MLLSLPWPIFYSIGVKYGSHSFIFQLSIWESWYVYLCIVIVWNVFSSNQGQPALSFIRLKIEYKAIVFNCFYIYNSVQLVCPEFYCAKYFLFVIHQGETCIGFKSQQLSLLFSYETRLCLFLLVMIFNATWLVRKSMFLIS